MSPEQERGAPVDKRADIWAFGVVLFELVTGKACFAGETVTDVLAAVVKSEPHWSALPPSTPWRLHELLHRCLAKDRRQRLHDVGDARLELEKIGAGDDREAQRADHTARRWKIASLSLGLIALGVCVGLLLSLTQARTVRQQTLPWRLSILHDTGSEVGVGAISPDGRRVVYRARGADGIPRLWVREIDSFEPKPLDGTVDANNPFWSPDSRHIGFAIAGAIKHVSANGGPITEVVRTPIAMGATWAPDDTIVFAKADYGLFRVPAGGGEATLVSKPLSPDWSHYWPEAVNDFETLRINLLE
jgi:serine/threonine-protein kinase